MDKNRHALLTVDPILRSKLKMLAAAKQTTMIELSNEAIWQYLYGQVRPQRKIDDLIFQLVGRLVLCLGDPVRCGTALADLDVDFFEGGDTGSSNLDRLRDCLTEIFAELNLEPSVLLNALTEGRI